MELPGPVTYSAPLRVLQLTEELREVLELQDSREDADSLRRQIPSDTAYMLLLWLTQGLAVSTVGTYGDAFETQPTAPTDIWISRLLFTDVLQKWFVALVAGMVKHNPNAASFMPSNPRPKSLRTVLFLYENILIHRIYL